MTTWKEVGMAGGASLSSSSPVDVGTTATEGIEGSASHYNHVHRLGTGAIDATNLFADNIVDGTALADDAVNAAELATLTAAIDFNDNQAKNMVVHKAATTPPTAVVGKPFYDTDAGKLYICTAL